MAKINKASSRSTRIKNTILEHPIVQGVTKRIENRQKKKAAKNRCVEQQVLLQYAQGKATAVDVATLSADKISKSNASPKKRKNGTN